MENWDVSPGGFPASHARGAPPVTPSRPGTPSRRALLALGGLTLLSSCAPMVQATQTRPGPGIGQGLPAPALAAHPHASPPRAPGTGTAPTARRGHAATTRAPAQPMTYIRDGGNAIALTIDDGPSPVYTPQILDLLAKYRVTATFSMIGIQVAECPALVREVAAAGHVIANHTWLHRNLPALTAPDAYAEIDRATEAIHRATGQVPRFFRAPGGAWSTPVLRHCQETGMIPLGWSVDPRDWSRPGVPHIIGNILANTRAGSIILEHDGGGDRSQTVAALSVVLPRLLDAGYHFRPV